MRKRLYALLGCLLAAAVIGGCSGSSDTQTSGSGSESGTVAEGDASAEGGKVIKYVMQNEPETLDPNMNNYANSSIVLQNLFTGLMQIGPDGSLINGCAESYEVSEDGLTYTFTLRDGLKWSDGQPLTAGDFEYSWKRGLNPETASPGAWYLFYLKNGEAYNGGTASAEDVGVKAVDDKTLEVTLEHPTTYFLDLTAVSMYFPTRQDVVEAEDAWTKSGDTYVCNGAFRIKEINPQASYVLEKNPEYIDADTVKLDGVEIVFIESQEAALSAYNAGEVDVLDNLVIGSQAQSQYSGSEELKSYDLVGTCYYDFNCEKEYLSDPKVRTALSISLNREVINQSMVASHLFAEDVEQAKSLMAEAGYPNGEGFPTLTLITQNDQEKKDVAQAMQAMWKENLGVNVEIVTYESKVYWDEQEAGNFDICYDGWTGDYPDPSTNLECLLLTRNETQCRWLNDKAQEYDGLLMEARASADNAARMEMFEQAERILIEEMPVIPVYYRNSQLLVKPNCKDVLKSYIGHTIFKYADKE